jgi:hypothetical protein
VEKLALTKEWVVGKLSENIECALQAARAGEDGEEQGEYRYQGNVANRSLELLGKELDMFIDRKEVGKLGEFESMSDEELDAQIEEFLSQTRASEGAQAIAAMPRKKGTQKAH